MNMPKKAKEDKRVVTVSLCMIVKNEEKILARCLDSIGDLADEIIIVDTGSRDRTKEIAARYTDKIYDFQWIRDFAAARNFAFSKAACDYIYSADADEVLDLVLRNELPGIDTHGGHSHTSSLDRDWHTFISSCVSQHSADFVIKLWTL